MVERIKEIILKEGLTSGSFADLIGVQRSSMSHILNGRNNPSLDFIIKTLQHFPKLNPEWLLNGSGSMYKQEVTVQPAPNVRERSIFDSEPEKAVITAPLAETKPIIEPKIPVEAKPVQEILTPKEVKQPEIQKDQVKKIEKYVNKVMIFYSDHTYDELVNTQKPEN